MKKFADKPLLQELLPELAQEIQTLLTKAGYPELAAAVASVRIVDKCRCGDDFCSSLYAVPKPSGPWGPGHYTIPLFPQKGLINIDVLNGEIVELEIIDRPEIKKVVEEMGD